ncbi:uncharacterized protein LOC144347221 [Saccoglossus kowalevskii]
MAGIIVEDTIAVFTESGECKIELCFGDITKLKKEDAVDIMMLPSFNDSQGSLPPIVNSIARSLNLLRSKLGMDSVSRDREEELSKNHSWWWSKPLSERYKFRRLVCCEIKRVVHELFEPAEYVRGMFRCLVSVLNNPNGSVIIPLTGMLGNKGSLDMVLKNVVEGSIHWIKAGLPLKLLKVVMCTEDELKSGREQYRNVCVVFAELKEKYDTKLFIAKEVTLEYDVCLSYHEKDVSTAGKIRQCLRKENDKIKIFEETEDIGDEEVWHEIFYQNIRKSTRVIAVLSPAYMESTRCMEQYNIALCHNRKSKRDVLAPFYVESVVTMPVYMELVQNHDVKKIQTACKNLSANLLVITSTNTSYTCHSSFKYDVFISYSHRNTRKASVFLDALVSLKPDLRIFFDAQELKTGTAWQETLYHAIDGSHCMLACISKDYLQSPVCQEEYNLALAKHYSKCDEHHHLIPLCIDDLTDPPLEFTKVPMLDYRNITQRNLEELSRHVVATIRRHCDCVLPLLRKPTGDAAMDVDALADRYQALTYVQKYGDLKTSEMSVSTSTPQSRSWFYGESKCDIAISFAKSDSKYAKLLSAMLKHYSPELVINDSVSSDHTQLSVLETARKVVCLISASYVRSRSQCEEFHVALFRHRNSPGSPVLFPILISQLPNKPTYFHLVPYEVSCTSLIWKDLLQDPGIPKTILDIRRECGQYTVPRIPRRTVMGLYKSAVALLLSIKADIRETTAKSPNIILLNVCKMNYMINAIENSEYTEDPTQYLYDVDWSQLENEDVKSGNTKSASSNCKSSSSLFHLGSMVGTILHSRFNKKP